MGRKRDLTNEGPKKGPGRKAKKQKPPEMPKILKGMGAGKYAILLMAKVCLTKLTKQNFLHSCQIWSREMCTFVNC